MSSFALSRNSKGKSHFDRNRCAEQSPLYLFAARAHSLGAPLLFSPYRSFYPYSLLFFFFSFGHLFPPLDGDTGVPARVFGWGIGRWKAWRRKGGDVKRKKAKEKSKKKARASVHERPTRSGGLSFLPVGRSKVCSISISLLIKFRMQKLHNVNCFCCNTLDNEKWQLLTCLQSDLNGVDNIREH